MIKVVVVDDEPYLLRSIKQSIEETNGSFAVVGEALDGESALEVIRRTRPDVIFTDIRMPVLDGLELIEELRRAKEEVLPVILSGYQDFEYAKRALQIGVEDYLLKPINAKALGKLLDELAAKVVAKRKSRQSDALESILKGRAGPGRIDSRARALFSPYSAFACLIICSGSYCNYASSLPTPASELWFGLNLESLIASKLDEGEDNWVIDAYHSNEKIALLGSLKKDKSSLLNTASQVHRALDSSGYAITTALDFVPSGDLASLPSLVRFLYGALRKRSVFGESRFFCLERLAEESLDAALVDSSQGKVFAMLVQSRQALGMKQEAEHVLRACEERHCEQYALGKKLMQICAPLCGSGRLDLSPEELVDNLLGESKDYASLGESLRFLIDDAMGSEESCGKREPKLGGTIEKIDEYLATNYSNPISLETVARQFGMTPSYLSSAYKKHKGIPPLKRITLLKIGKAKELLSIEAPLSIKEISDAIGYEDPYYFSRIFKAVEGLSPSAFREKARGLAPKRSAS
jgi:Response regulator containing CheY-like receiver domain and AraC-type DNA-binding domain